jgi:hypothetical protein
VLPNVRAKVSTDGVTPGPDGRQCTPYLPAGPGGMPLVLPLSEGLGSTLRADPALLLLAHCPASGFGPGCPQNWATIGCMSLAFRSPQPSSPKKFRHLFSFLNSHFCVARTPKDVSVVVRRVLAACGRPRLHWPAPAGPD